MQFHRQSWAHRRVMFKQGKQVESKISINATSELVFGRHACPIVKERVTMGLEISALVHLFKWNRFLEKYTRQCFVRGEMTILQSL